MTTKENVGKAYMLSIVEQQIRKDIPRLMELREGCLLIKNEKPDNGLEKGDIVKIDCIWNDIIQVSPIGLLFSRNYVECQINSLFEIIGHDIMLNDVLEWLNKRINENIFGRYVLQANGEFRIISKDEEGYDVEFTGIKWNLQSPHLNIDQSEELIKFLYNLQRFIANSN